MKYFVLAIIFFQFTLYSYSYSAEQHSKNEKIAAMVNGAVITQASLDREINKILPLTTYHRKMPNHRKKEIIKTALDNLIIAELEYQKAKMLGFKIPEKKIKQELKIIKSRFHSNSEFKKTLKNNNMTVADLKKNVIERNLLIQKINKKKEDVKVTEETLYEYYTKNKNLFVMPEQRRLLQILFKVDPGASKKQWNSTKKKAEDLLAQVKTGKDFSTLINSFSTDLANYDTRELGFIHDGQLPSSELNKAAFNLKKGEITKIIQSLYGFHILKLEEIKESKAQKFDQLNKAYLIKELKVKLKKEKKDAWIKSLKKDASIDILVEELI